MNWRQRLEALLHRGRFHREMEEEIAFHIEATERELIASGLTAEEAHRQARVRFGSREATHERVHKVSALPLESCLHDLRFGLRMMRKNPVFSIVVVLSLALGIGANVAIFTVMKTVMLDALPVREPGRLLMLQSGVKDGVFPEKFMHDYEGSTWVEDKSGLRFGGSMPRAVYDAVRKQSTAFENTFAFASNEENVNVGLGKRAESGKLQGVSGTYFDGLGLVPYEGRLIRPSDDDAAAPAVAVVGYKFFMNQLNGDPAAIGRMVTINDTPAQLVGVAPPDFLGLDPTVAPDFWIPLSIYAAQWQRNAGPNDDTLDNSFVWWLTVVGRLKPGITAQQALAETSVLFGHAVQAPQDGKDATIPLLRLADASHGLAFLRQRYSSSLWLLAGTALAVLLIACANVATLTLARGTARRGELATRIGLGATRGRVVQQLTIECILLSVAGCCLGLLISQWMTAVLLQLLNNRASPLGIAVRVSPPVLLFALAVSLICSLLCGLAPAVGITRSAVSGIVKQTSAAVRGSFRTGRALVAIQVALCVTLVMAAGLMLRTLHKLQSIRLGFRPQNVVAFTVRPGLNGYANEKLLRYYDNLLEQVSRLAGVRSATFAQFGPVGEGSSSSLVYIPGFNTSEKRSEYSRHIVGNRYFETLGIPIVMGRALGERDTPTSKGAIVVNETLAKKYFAGQNPVGRQAILGTREKPRICEVVGVAQDVRYAEIRDEVPPTVYIPISQTPYPLDEVSFLVSTVGDTRALPNMVRAAALEIDPSVPVVNFRSEKAVIDQHLSTDRTFARLSSGFAMMGLVLACIGLYGTVAYGVARRTGEIGVRLAVGAARFDIMRMVVGETLTVAVVGIAIGLPGAWFFGQALRSQMYGLGPHDWLTQVSAVGTLLLVSFCAGVIPARSAAAIDPVAALRNE